MKKRFNTRQLTILGLLTGILLLMAYTPLGYLNIGPLAISFNVIPVALAAVTLGPAGGAAAGAVFGRIFLRISEYALFHDCSDSALRKYRIRAGAHRRKKYSAFRMLLCGHQRGLRNGRFYHSDRRHRLCAVPLPAFRLSEVGRKRH